MPRRVWVEVLDERGGPVPDGQRGEVVVTVDENPYLPLLRYRTGDTAALVRDHRGTVLVGLQGRAPVRFLAADGSWRSSIDATQLLQAYGLAGWELVQDAAELGPADRAAARRACRSTRPPRATPSVAGSTARSTSTW